MREKEAYRANLEWLNEIFPEKGLLTITDISQAMGLSRQTASKMFGAELKKHGNRISKPTLATILS